MRKIEDNNNNKIKIYILKQEIDYIKKIVEDKKFFNLETCGILIGNKINNQSILILKVTGPGPNAEHYSLECAHDTEYEQNILNRYRKEYNVYWVGSWHKHPDQLNHPSFGDIQQMKEFIDDDETLDEIVNLIITINNKEVFINAFYMDKEKILKKISYEILGDNTHLIDEFRRTKKKDDKKKSSRKDIPSKTENSWYETVGGIKRLKNELEEMRNRYNILGVTIANKDKNLIINARITSLRSIIFTCPKNFPFQKPIVHVKNSNELKEIDKDYIDDWNSAMALTQIIDKIILNENIFCDLKETVFKDRVDQKWSG